MNRALVTIPLLAAALTLAACSSSTPVPRHSPTPAQPTPAAYGNTTACAAFRQATTTGVPAADAGEDTMTWLQSQEGGASPALQAQIGDFVTAWQDTPPDTAGINQATKAIEGMCAAGG